MAQQLAQRQRSLNQRIENMDRDMNDLEELWFELTLQDREKRRFGRQSHIFPFLKNWIYKNKSLLHFRSNSVLHLSSHIHIIGECTNTTKEGFMLYWLSSLAWASELTLYPLFLPTRTRKSNFSVLLFSGIWICALFILKNAIENTIPTYRIIKTDFQKDLTAFQAYERALYTVKDDIFDRFPDIYKNNTLPDMTGSYLSSIGETGLGCAAVLYPQALNWFCEEHQWLHFRLRIYLLYLET